MTTITIWIAIVYSSTTFQIPPVQFASEAECKAFIKDTPTGFSGGCSKATVIQTNQKTQ